MHGLEGTWQWKLLLQGFVLKLGGDLLMSPQEPQSTPLLWLDTQSFLHEEFEFLLANDIQSREVGQDGLVLYWEAAEDNQRAVCVEGLSSHTVAM